VSHPFPPEIIARAQGIADGSIPPVEPRDAATVVLVRDGEEREDGRLEVFLLRRLSTMAFAPSAYVFPGGKVEVDDDGGPDLPAEWAETFCYGDAALLRRVVGAAIRETEEECGVVVTAASLRPFAHWLTPEIEKRRYDTRFLLAALPDGQTARLNDGEADRGAWVSPAAGSALPMLPPTKAVLAELAADADVATALARPREIRRVHPTLVPDGDSWRLEVQYG
jgi:8-oxo-dGTP pyrophosphatase MutT (NUDIX family)